MIGRITQSIEIHYELRVNVIQIGLSKVVLSHVIYSDKNIIVMLSVRRLNISEINCPPCIFVLRFLLRVFRVSLKYVHRRNLEVNTLLLLLLSTIILSLTRYNRQQTVFIRKKITTIIEKKAVRMPRDGGHRRFTAVALLGRHCIDLLFLN